MMMRSALSLHGAGEPQPYPETPRISRISSVCCIGRTSGKMGKSREMSSLSSTPDAQIPIISRRSWRNLRRKTTHFCSRMTAHGPILGTERKAMRPNVICSGRPLTPTRWAPERTFQSLFRPATESSTYLNRRLQNARRRMGILRLPTISAKQVSRIF